MSRDGWRCYQESLGEATMSYHSPVEFTSSGVRKYRGLVFADILENTVGRPNLAGIRRQYMIISDYRNSLREIPYTVIFLFAILSQRQRFLSLENQWQVFADTVLRDESSDLQMDFNSLEVWSQAIGIAWYRRFKSTRAVRNSSFQNAIQKRKKQVSADKW